MSDKQREAYDTDTEQNMEDTEERKPQDTDRDMVKQQIRDRVRNARVADNAVFIPAKPEPKINDDGHKLVAAYTRVSTLSTEQVSSIENQTRFYTEKIEKNPNWTLQKIYSDEGKSGTSMKKRAAFREMLKDAKDNKMDLILCASVSRFARNVSDCMEQVRELRTQNPSHPVGVFFETENIYTLDQGSHQALSMHAMLADWESANKSRRMIISYDQRICMGQYPLADGLGYRHTKDGQLVIVDDEARTVRFIFLSYLLGASLSEIANDLTEMGRETLLGRKDWNEGMVHKIMINERRWGDLKVRKTVIVDYVKGTRVKNDQIRDAAFVSGHHESIVSPAIAKAARMIMDSSYGHTGGVADTAVITEGALKGFVSISPTWGGMNIDSLTEICRQAYTEEEYQSLLMEERIRCGDEHSKVVPMDMGGYQVPYGVTFITSQSPVLTMSRTYMRVNPQVHRRFEDCEFIEVLFHPILRMLVIREADGSSGNDYRWDCSRRILNIPAMAFCKAVYQKMDWITSFRFMFRGITRERDGERIMAFYLDEPQILPDKKTKEEYHVENGGASIQYIPYHKAEVAHGKKAGRETVDFGLSVTARKYRDKLINNITGDDIRQKPVLVVNPIIGDLPDRQEISQELEALLASM